MYIFREEEKPKFKLSNAFILSLLLLLILLWTADDENMFMLSAEELKQLELQREQEEREMVFRFLDEPEDDVEHENPEFLSDANRIKKSQEEQQEPENNDPISQGNTFELAKSLAPQATSSAPPVEQPPSKEQLEEPEMEEVLPEEPEEPEPETPPEEPVENVEELEDTPEKQTETKEEPALPGPGQMAPDPGAPKPFKPISQAARKQARKMASQEMKALSVNQDMAHSQTSYNNPNGSSAPFTGMSIETSRSDLGPYLKILKQLIKGNWRIPNIARFEVSGVAVVSFKIHKDGKFSDATLVTDSGYQPLDTSALNAIINTYQAPPLPQYVDEEWVPIRFAFYYNMRPNY